MAEKKAKMVCPECGVAMNHHADKLVDPTSPAEAAKMDAALGGLVEETHTCPECGKGASRPAVA